MIELIETGTIRGKEIVDEMNWLNPKQTKESIDKIGTLVYLDTLYLWLLSTISYQLFNDPKLIDDINKTTKAIESIITLQWFTPVYSDNGYLIGIKINDDIKQLYQNNNIYDYIDDKTWQQYNDSIKFNEQQQYNKQSVLTYDNNDSIISLKTDYIINPKTKIDYDSYFN